MDIPDLAVFDFDGNEIKVGTRVRYYDDANLKQGVGVVKEITDFEGDVDDEGHPRMVDPFVSVLWGGEEDTQLYVTSEWEYEYMLLSEGSEDEPPYHGHVPVRGKVEELMVVKDA